MSAGTRRRRAIAFALLAAAAATIAAVLANGYGSSVARGYGPLRPVVVTRDSLPAGRQLGPAELDDALEVRRIPSRFVPPGAIARPIDVLGLEPTASLPAGAYVIAGQLRPPRRPRSAAGSLPDGRRPVEIAVAGAGALLAGGATPQGTMVDVVVTAEPSGLGPGRTFVAAPRVRLLALAPGLQSPGPGATATATLALSKHQALRLIAAESFARQIRLLPIPVSRRPAPPRRRAGPSDR